jgi:uncharacterized membrane protein
MELPIIKIPEIPLPFDIPVLLHPAVDHFIIALPVIVLLLEIINIFAKKKAIGFISFFLIILTVVAAVGAYLTGTVDGKEAYNVLSQAGQIELKHHKVLGTYIMLASAIVLLFKLLSAIIQRGMMKSLYLLILVLFVVGILKQGKEGGELVYKYGANVERVKALDDELFDTKEELDEAKEDLSDAVEEAKENVSKAKDAVEAKTDELVKSVEKKSDEVKKEVTQTTKEVVQKVEAKVEEAKEVVKEELSSKNETPATEDTKKEEVAKEEVAKEEATKADEAKTEEPKEEAKPEVKEEEPSLTQKVEAKAEESKEAVEEVADKVLTPATETTTTPDVAPATTETPKAEASAE